MELALALLVDREDGICHLCDGKVDPTANQRDATYPTVDRLRPGAFGGEYEPANVKLAHLRCNQQRGNDPVWMWKGFTMTTNDKRQQVILRLDPTDADVLKKAAERTGRSMNSIASQAIRSFLDETGAYRYAASVNLTRSTGNFTTGVSSTSNAHAHTLVTNVTSNAFAYEERDPYQEAIAALSGTSTEKKEDPS